MVVRATPRRTAAVARERRKLWVLTPSRPKRAQVCRSALSAAWRRLCCQLKTPSRTALNRGVPYSYSGALGWLRSQLASQGSALPTLPDMELMANNNCATVATIQRKKQFPHHQTSGPWKTHEDSTSESGARTKEASTHPSPPHHLSIPLKSRT